MDIEGKPSIYELQSYKRKHVPILQKWKCIRSEKYNFTNISYMVSVTMLANTRLIRFFFVIKGQSSLTNKGVEIIL